MTETIIAPKSAIALSVRKGQILRVCDLDGAQVADLVCFAAIDYKERFSQAKSRIQNWKVRIGVGDVLVSNRNNVMFAIVEDRVGVHDILFCPCHSYVYENMFKVGPRNGCQENLAAALVPYGLTIDDVPDPFNMFMNTAIDDQNKLIVRKAPSEAGDYIELRAEMDCLVAISACADDYTECNGRRCTRIGVEVR